MDFGKLALEEAEKSLCKKRKVGAIIVSGQGKVLARGHNYLNVTNLFSDWNCEDAEGNTKDNVIHAEIAALSKLSAKDRLIAKTIYVTHTPCDNCKRAISRNNLDTIVVDKFMKFDDGKLKYNLLPPKAFKEMAKVLTYGAKKYKPNNWQHVDDTTRYIDALYRHLEAWRAGDKIDEESKLSHLSHALTNIAFLIHFEDIK